MSAMRSKPKMISKRTALTATSSPATGTAETFSRSIHAPKMGFFQGALTASFRCLFPLRVGGTQQRKKDEQRLITVSGKT